MTGEQYMAKINTLNEMVNFLNEQEDINWGEVAEIIAANGWEMCDGDAVCTDGRSRVVLKGEKAEIEKKPVVRMLYPTKAAALAALEESGKDGYLSSADDRSDLDIADGFEPGFSWSGEVEAMRTDDGDVFAWWE